MDLTYILKDAIKFIEESFQERRIDININNKLKKPKVLANDFLLDVFTNIMNNAVKYNENSIVEIVIRISEEIKDHKEYEIIMEGQTVEAKNALDNRKLLISKFPFLVGRYVLQDPDSDVFYNNDLAILEEKPYVISRNHLSINKELGLLWVVDRGSAFGVIVNGKEIGGPSGVTRALLDKDENQMVIGPATSRYIFLLKKDII